MVIKEDYKHSIPSSHTTRTRTCAPASGNNCNQTACSIRKLFDIKLNFFFILVSASFYACTMRSRGTRIIETRLMWLHGFMMVDNTRWHDYYNFDRSEVTRNPLHSPS